MRIGVFGGTFDPPHLGHLIVAQDAFAALRLDRLLFVPAAVPPHKRDRVTAPPELRLAMLRAAIAGDPRFDVDDVELRRAGPSYTIDTLHELRERHPEAELFFLLGADQLRELDTWREPQEIARLASLVALSREGSSAETPPSRIPHESLAVTRIDISATEIRRRVANGEPIRYLVVEEVRQMIEKEGLYRP